MMLHSSMRIKWFGRWIGHVILKDTFPGIYPLSKTKNAIIKEMISEPEAWNFSFKKGFNGHGLRDGATLLQMFGEVTNLINGYA